MQSYANLIKMVISTTILGRLVYYCPVSKEIFPFKKALIVLFILPNLIACSPGPDILFDTERWVNDYNGCLGNRMVIYNDLFNQRSHLLGLSSKRIVKTLGRPNINELYQRNQKFFIYQISPGSSCNKTRYSQDLYLIIRFNALGLANEIYLSDKSSPTD